MELTKDILLHGSAWSTAVDKMTPIFKTRPNFMVFMLALSIGIMYDQRIENLPDENEETKTIPRTVLQHHGNGKLDVMFQAAILTTTTMEIAEEQRLDLAFGEKSEFNKIGFLVEFANFGVTKLLEQIADTPIETMDNIKNYLNSIVEGRDLDLDEIPDDILLLDE